MALLCQHQSAAAKLTEEDTQKINNLLERLRSVLAQTESPPSSPPIFDDDAAEVDDYIDNPGGVHRSIRPDTFKIGYEAGYEIKAAPSTGRVTLDLIDDTNKKIVLHVDARYKWYSSNNVLVFNGYNGGWGTEQRPSGFDFTPGKSSLVTVKAETNAFHIHQNGKHIAAFQYRSGLPVTSVNRIRIRSEGNQAAKDATLNINFH